MPLGSAEGHSFFVLLQKNRNLYGFLFLFGNVASRGLSGRPLEPFGAQL